MGIVTLSKQNHLFWLGRYAERVYGAIQLLMELYDQLIDGGEIDYAALCQELGVPCPYESGEDFCRRYLFDGSDPASVRSSLDAMLGNGMVLRETITTPHPGLPPDGPVRPGHCRAQRRPRRGAAVGTGRHYGLPGQL